MILGLAVAKSNERIKYGVHCTVFIFQCMYEMFGEFNEIFSMFLRSIGWKYMLDQRKTVILVV